MSILNHNNPFTLAICLIVAMEHFYILYLGKFYFIFILMYHFNIYLNFIFIYFIFNYILYIFINNNNI